MCESSESHIGSSRHALASGRKPRFSLWLVYNVQPLDFRANDENMLATSGIVGIARQPMDALQILAEEKLRECSPVWTC